MEVEVAATEPGGAAAATTTTTTSSGACRQFPDSLSKVTAGSFYTFERSDLEECATECARRKDCLGFECVVRACVRVRACACVRARACVHACVAAVLAHQQRLLRVVATS